MKFLSEQFSFEDATTVSRLIREGAIPGMVVVELGTFTGRSALTMLPTIKKMGGHLFCVDWFRGLPEEDVTINASYKEDYIIDIFLENIRENSFNDVVTTIVSTTAEAALLGAVGFADFIFVDADHRYSGIRQDILNWYPKLKEGGIICGHDFEKHLQECDTDRAYQNCEIDFDFNDECHYGVIRAVSELFPNVHRDGRIWWVRKGEDAPSILPVFHEQLTVFHVAEPVIKLSESADHDYLVKLFANDPELTDAHLVDTNVAGYNIVLYKGIFYGLAIELGKIDIRTLDTNVLRTYLDDGRIIKHSSLEKVRQTIEHGIGPHLIAEQVNGYNIVLYRNTYYALPISLGAIDITNEKDRLRPEVLESKNLAQLKSMIGLPSERNAKQEIRFTLDDSIHKKLKALFLGTVTPEVGRNCLQYVPDFDMTYLVPESQDGYWMGERKIHFQPYNPAKPVPLDVTNIRNGHRKVLVEQEFDAVIIPYAETFPKRVGSVLEEFAGNFAHEIIHVFPSGRTRRYRGEDINRLTYSRAYFDSMLQHIGSVEGKNILDIGCSDGLGCDLMLVEKPASITGVDTSDHVGARFPDPIINYARMDARQLEFSPNSFDVAYSIAVFEHIQEPIDALKEMIRVIKPGGYGYIQAGPLYNSPFGHHMFGYFDDYPWIHLRLTSDEIISYAREQGIDRLILENTGRDVVDYIHSMINVQHINGLAFEDYGLVQLAESGAVEILHYVKSYDGKKWLTSAIQQEIAYVNPDDLVIDRFEIAFKVL
ncbi:methyltransferase domain-containing protein [candidate division KSB1 bacterium]|nr:methyltransferase domain-containing protein [candidate division KSB1 bacterium]